ncbi:MAG: glycosyltransferase [Deltaproteobacteria bacterium]|nr:glycosyltransferase [Deltaproteobacteria bacterium]
MTIIAAVFFVACVIALFLPYVGYPFVLKSLGDARADTWRSNSPLADGVSIIIAAYNEAANIRAKLDNLLAQDAPLPMQVIVASDASDDGMDDIVREYADRGVELLRMDARGGKSLAQNAAVALARHEILVFTDASVLLDNGAIAALVRELRDPTVGCVSGEDVSISGSEHDSTQAAGFYTRYEIAVRRLENRKLGTLIGVSGCLFAVRSFLRRDVPPEAVDDLAVPLHVVARGFRVVATPDARAFVRRAVGVRQEFRRKVRTFTGAMFTLRNAWTREDRVGLRRAMIPIVFHKLGRWLGPALAAGALASCAWLARTHVVWCAVLVAQLSAWVVGAFAFARDLARDGEFRKPGGGAAAKLTKFASFFVTVQLALVAAWWRFARGKSFAVWSPTVRETS